MFRQLSELGIHVSLGFVHTSIPLALSTLIQPYNYLVRNYFSALLGLVCSIISAFLTSGPWAETVPSIVCKEI